MSKLCADYLLLQSWWHYHHFVTEKLKNMGIMHFCSCLISYLCLQDAFLINHCIPPPTKKKHPTQTIWTELPVIINYSVYIKGI